MELCSKNICPTHQTEANYLCFDKLCERVCIQCLQHQKGSCYSHSKYVLTQEQTLQNIHKNTIDCNQHSANAMLRYQKLATIANLSIDFYNTKEQHLLKAIMTKLETQKNTQVNTKIKIQSIQAKLNASTQRLHYFDVIKQKDLLSIKLAMSSEEGMKDFKRKCEELADMTSKQTLESHKTLLNELTKEQEQLQMVQTDGTIVQLKNLVQKRANMKSLLKKESQSKAANKENQKKEQSLQKR